MIDSTTHLQGRAALVSGGLGFIGSHLVDALLAAGCSRVVVLDDESTGHCRNLAHIADPRLQLHLGSTTQLQHCQKAVAGCHYVFHQAALGSVPRSLADPMASHVVNVNGHLNMLIAARDAGVQRVVYASSSSVYGDHPKLPKTEEDTGRPLSPYAVTKASNELYADTFARSYGMQVVGLRYFNVFGPRQSPSGPYAAVIPLFISQVLAGVPPLINGDGSNSRDFTHVANVVLANLLAATQPLAQPHRVYNVAAGQRTTLLQLFQHIATALGSSLQPQHGPHRPGDIPHSLADLSRITSELGYTPSISVAQGLASTCQWFAQHGHAWA